MEFDFDFSVGQSFICCSDDFNSFFKEVLLALVDDDSGEWASIESDSGSWTDDDAWQQQFVENWSINCSECSAVRSLLSSILFNPSWLDVSGWEQKDSFFQFFFKFVDYFFIECSEQNFMASISELWIIFTRNKLGQRSYLLRIGIQELYWLRWIQQFFCFIRPNDW